MAANNAQICSYIVNGDIALDPIFAPDDRCTLSPVRYPLLLEALEKQQKTFWTPIDVRLHNDIAQWRDLDEHEKRPIILSLAFFANSDVKVNKDSTARFLNEIDQLEFQMIYRNQMMMEDIHTRVYTMLIDTYIPNADDRRHLFNAVREMPSVAQKAHWFEQWMNSSRPFVDRLFATACMEGLLFSASFCFIFRICDSGILSGLQESNQLISRDEGMHVETAIIIHSYLRDKLSQSVAHEIMRGAVEAESIYVRDALTAPLPGMNAELMIKYVKFVANRILLQFGIEPLYAGATNPFSFMDKIALSNKTNFFEKTTTEYQQPSVNTTTNISGIAATYISAALPTIWNKSAANNHHILGEDIDIMSE
jgi:ribonucleoside-diphosphate reductase beta chain